MLNRCGFTVVEVVVALFVFMVGILATASVFASSTRTLVNGFDSINASARATEVLEAARAAGCGGVASGLENEGNLNVSWRAYDMGSELLRVTVVVGSATIFSHSDTFSAILPC